MTAPCDHPDTIPVDIRDHTTGGTRTVAHICVDCLEQLHAGWGCEECNWQDVAVPRRLCDPHIVVVPVLVTPCPAHHQGA